MALGVSFANSPFEMAKRVDNFGEWWSGRDLAKILEYAEYRNFTPVVAKAKEACINSGFDSADHFVDINEMVTIGSGAERSVKSVRLTRYACYLIIQNADPSKEVVAHGQTYFAVQTRKQELQDLNQEELLRIEIRDRLRAHNKDLAAAAKEVGVDTNQDFARFQNEGYRGLYGGLKVRQIKQRKNLEHARDWLDFISSEELAANLFRATQTEAKLRRDDVQGKEAANKLHYEVGVEVRETIRKLGNEMPENLPPAEDLKRVRARLSEIQKQNAKAIASARKRELL